jgi:hypothetical protein
MEPVTLLIFGCIRPGRIGGVAGIFIKVRFIPSLASDGDGVALIYRPIGAQMWRDVGELIGDVALVAATNEYAAWLAEHKQLEPDWTWLEVALGTALCLAHSTAVGGCAAATGRPSNGAWCARSESAAVPVVMGRCGSIGAK